MVFGVAFALAAGLLWGLVFVGPVLLPDYPAALQSFGRYLAFGLIALPLGWLDRQELARFTRQDWIDATKLSAVGNVLYYVCLASAIQHAGPTLATMIIGTLPVVIAIASNMLPQANSGAGAPLPWARLLPSVAIIAVGIACVNHVELAALAATPNASRTAYAGGALLALVAVGCWTWYPIRNAHWLRSHPGRNPRTWATAQGLCTLPLALMGYAGFWLWAAVTTSPFAMPFGPRPMVFVAMMVAIGFLASWLGTLCWNEASQRLPTALAGQLIVFETLAALAYAFALRQEWPQPLTLLGVALLVCGVIWAVRTQPAPLRVD
jgi:drug/metabolite transporter (DMT)-like permease